MFTGSKPSNGSIGAEIVRRMIEAYEKSQEQEQEEADGKEEKGE